MSRLLSISLSLPLLALLVLLPGCGKSPEAAAQEVCACMQETAASNNLGELSGNASACQTKSNEYASKFKGEKREEFARAVMACTTEGLFGR